MLSLGQPLATRPLLDCAASSAPAKTLWIPDILPLTTRRKTSLLGKLMALRLWHLFSNCMGCPMPCPNPFLFTGSLLTGSKNTGGSSKVDSWFPTLLRACAICVKSGATRGINLLFVSLLELENYL